MKGEESFCICKNFYLLTWSASQKMIYGIHEKKEEVSGIVKPDSWGKHNNQYKVTQEVKEKVIAHVNSFPVIDLHYCQAKTIGRFEHRKNVWPIQREMFNRRHFGC